VAGKPQPGASAGDAGEGEILGDGLASMLTCNDVIDMKGQTIDMSGR
jgi:hypothetical protein